jgi:cytochrome b561
MSLHTEIRGTAKLTAPADRYDRILMAVHWLTLLLIAAVYGAVWASHAAGSREQSALLVQLHRSMGLTILALTLFRLAWRWNALTPPLPAESPMFQRLAARATEYILYVLLLLQPVLGLLNTNARGRRVDLYLLALSSRRVAACGWPGQVAGQEGDGGA